MFILKIILEGMADLANVYVDPRDYVRPSNGGFQEDQERLRNDVRKVGNDMKKTIKKHGEQPYELTSH